MVFANLVVVQSKPVSQIICQTFLDETYIRNGMICSVLEPDGTAGSPSAVEMTQFYRILDQYSCKCP